MTIFKQIHESANSCSEYFDESRFKDFAYAIKELMDGGKSYGDAKAEVFDEDQLPPAEGACCKRLQAAIKAMK